MPPTLTRRGFGAAAFALATDLARPCRQPGCDHDRLATYNPVSPVLRQQRLLEQAFAPHKIEIRWVQSQGSSKALEFLNAGSIHFGSTAGAAALIARVNGTQANSPIHAVAHLKGQRIAVTRGTHPHIFLVRAPRPSEYVRARRETRPAAAPGRSHRARPGEVQAWARARPDDGAGRA